MFDEDNVEGVTLEELIEAFSKETLEDAKKLENFDDDISTNPKEADPSEIDKDYSARLNRHNFKLMEKKEEFLEDLKAQWLTFEGSKKIDRRIIGYSLLGLMLGQMIYIYHLVDKIAKGEYTLEPSMFNFLITGVFVEIVGLFAIVVTNLFKDSGDQALDKIIELFKLENKNKD